MFESFIHIRNWPDYILLLIATGVSLIDSEAAVEIIETVDPVLRVGQPVATESEHVIVRLSLSQNSIENKRKVIKVSFERRCAVNDNHEQTQRVA